MQHTTTPGLLYVASSWRNPIYDGVIAVLRAAQIPHYDFKHPVPDNNGFHWREIDPTWQQWTPAIFRQALGHRLACDGFAYDMDALKASNRLLLVLPCGRSAHLELGYAIGAGKQTIIYLPDTYQIEPELMYKAADHLCINMGEVLACLGVSNEGPLSQEPDHAIGKTATANAALTSWERQRLGAGEEHADIRPA